jgi:outer membrane receptor protein involved in Fe transport
MLRRRPAAPAHRALTGGALALAPALAAAQPAAPGGELTGRVTQQATRRAVEGAEVLVFDGTPAPAQRPSARALTDATGRYRVSGLVPGARTLVVRAIGALPDTVPVTVPPAGAARRDVALRRPAVALNEVTVSAQKRTQSARDVPIAVTAWEGDFLRQTDTREFDQLSQYVPGLNVQLQSPNNPGFVVRGITSDDGSSQVEPRVSVFQDGVSISKSRGSVVELFDLERVEVLKGPQGTLFGRGAQIGAVHLIQNKPAAERGGELRLGAGTYGEVFASGVVNAPLGSDRVLGRLSGVYNRREGFIENLAGGTLNGKETLALRGALRVLPGARTVLDVIGNYQRDTPPGIAFRSLSPANAGQVAGRRDLAFADARLEGGEALGVDRTVWGATVLGTHRFTPALALNNVTAFRRFDSDEAFDADGTAAPALRFNEIARGDQFSQELRLTYDRGGRLTGFGGASYFREDGSQRVPFVTDERSLFLVAVNSPAVRQAFAARGVTLPQFPSFVNPDGTANLSVTRNPIPFAPGVQGAAFNPVNREAYENFGRLAAAETFLDGTLRLTRGLRLTAGVRGTYEEVRNAYEVTNAELPTVLGGLLPGRTNVLFAPTNGRLRGSGVFRSAVGRVVGQYETVGGANLFASAARGRRPNVVQVNAGGANTLRDEVVWSYEAGAKGAALGGRLAAEANAFYYDYNNFQTSIVALRPDGSPAAQTLDAGNALAYGAESTVRAQLLRSLGAFATYGYLEARVADEDDRGRRQTLAGKRFRLAPKHQASVGATLDVGAGVAGRLALTPTVSYRSHVYFEPQNQAGIEQGGYALVNLRAALASAGGRWELAAIGRNLLDREYLIDAGNTGGGFGIPTFIAGQPRLVSVQLARRF